MKYLCIIFPRGEGTLKVVFQFDSYKPQSNKLESVQVSTDAKVTDVDKNFMLNFSIILDLKYERFSLNYEYPKKMKLQINKLLSSCHLN